MKFTWFSRRLAALCLLLAMQAAAGAQQPGVRPPEIGSYTPPNVSLTPALSPYLNLGRGGYGSINYYGLVRPQLQVNQAFQQAQMEQLRNSVHGLSNVPVTVAYPGLQQPMDLGTTGHPVYFFNTGRYFPVTQGRTTSSGVNFGNPFIRR